MKVMLSYSFIFEPSDLWSNRYMLEESLSSMFAKVGIEAELVETPAKKNGEVEHKILILKRKEMRRVSFCLKT